jgi:hypothetical protein
MPFGLSGQTHTSLKREARQPGEWKAADGFAPSRIFLLGRTFLGRWLLNDHAAFDSLRQCGASKRHV